MLTRKHYVKVAAILKAEGDQYGSRITDRAEGTAAVESVTKALAGVFAADNPRFDRGKFLQAAGVQP